jgi:hypothetical protein
MEKKQTAVQWLIQEICGEHTEAWKDEIKQALEMENETNQDYYNQGTQDCKNVFEKIISDVTKINLPKL